MAADEGLVRDSRAQVVRVGENGPASWLVRDSFIALAEGPDRRSVQRIIANEMLARALGDDEAGWRCREILVSALAAAGQLEDALALAEDLIHRYDTRGETASRLQVLGQTISIRLGRGEFERALDELADALAGLTRLRASARASASAFLTVANAASGAEMFEIAASQLRRAVQLARNVAIPFLSRAIDSAIARNELRLASRLELIGHPDEAHARYREVLRAAIRVQADEPGRYWLRIGRLYEGYAWASLGEPDVGRAALLEALGRDEAALDNEDSLVMRLGLAKACAALGLVSDARGHLEKTGLLADHSFTHQWHIAIMLEAAEVERVEHGDHPGIDLARQAGRLLAQALWAERDRRLEAVMVRLQMLDLAAENERVGQAATEDALTGLGNRRRLDSALHELNQDLTTNACLLFIDLDKFKNVNDLFSHAIGDEVLKAVANLLRAECRESDLLVRYGGDEFVVVLRGADIDAAARAAERIRMAVTTYPWWGVAHGLSARISIGIAEHQPGMTYEELMGAADAALYRAKQLGRDRVAVA
jgi:diguanylate cyclase